MSTVACMSRASRGALNEWDPFVPSYDPYGLGVVSPMTPLLLSRCHR
jgi:hypothetical protein